MCFNCSFGNRRGRQKVHNSGKCIRTICQTRWSFNYFNTIHCILINFYPVFIAPLLTLLPDTVV